MKKKTILLSVLTLTGVVLLSSCNIKQKDTNTTENTPTIVPTTAPTVAPTIVPTTVVPTTAPTAAPTIVPTTVVPTTAPTVAPTTMPTTVVPTTAPTVAPTTMPTTVAPTTAPTVAPHVHSYEFVNFVWNGYTAKANYICPSDNQPATYDAVITSAITKNPTCTDDGVRTYTATYDGHTDTKTEVIPATDHNYQFSSFVWNDYTAKAYYVCSNNGAHDISYDATITSKVTKEPTVSSTGVRTYTATYDGHTDTKDETIPKLTPSITFGNDNLSVLSGQKLYAENFNTNHSFNYNDNSLGIYGYNNDSSGTATSLTAFGTSTNVEITNGALALTDSSSTYGSNAIVNVGNISSGVIEVYAIVSVSSQSGKYTLLELQDNTGKLLCHVRSDSSQSLFINSVAGDGPTGSYVYKANEELKIKFTIDFDNKTAAATVNGTDLGQVNITGTSLNYLKLTTSVGSSRNISLSALEIAKQAVDESLANAKEEAKAAITQVYNEGIASLTSEQLAAAQSKINSIKLEANSNINAATTVAQVESVKNNYISRLNEAFENATKDPSEITVESEVKITEIKGGNENASFTFTEATSISNYNYYIKGGKYTSYTLMDSNLAYTEDLGTSRKVYVIGLAAGTYDIKVVAEDKNVESDVHYDNTSVTVSAYDRSGYAHFNYSAGVGAYNNDGTLKDNAQVIYVTNETKNTVTLKIGTTTYTGLVAILQAAQNSSNPISIRIVDSIKTNQWVAKDDKPRVPDVTYTEAEKTNFMTNELETTYGENLVGLRNKLMDMVSLKNFEWTTTKTGLSSVKSSTRTAKTTTYNGTKYSDLTGKTVYDDDSYFNMLDISGAKNLTLEGITSNAEFFQFGLNWTDCNSIEVRNIEFTSYTEDACSFGGSISSKKFTSNNIWVHNNIFNKGKNNWDVTGERDKPAGDGAYDLTTVKGSTLSYNIFNNCKKTGLVGGSDSVLNMDVTFHHNYYNQVGSRLPLGRQANMHIYNNYYYKCSTAQDIRANAFVLSEYNYFDSCTNAQKVSFTNDTKNGIYYLNTVIKSFNDYFNGGSSQATKVTSRDAVMSLLDSSKSACMPDGSTNYFNFDTNSTYFYYDSVNKKSNVTTMQTTKDDIKNYTTQNAGKIK